jgi:multiple sugar transport system permease protein
MSTTPRERALWLIAILVVVLYALVPVVWIASISLKQTADITDGNFLPTGGISFDNYKTLFQTSDFNHALVNSLGIAGISTLISIVLAAMAAYALSRLDFRGKTLILSGSLAVAMFPPISIVGSLFNLWRQIGLFDTWAGLIIP